MVQVDAVVDDLDSIQVFVQKIDVLLISNGVFGNIQGRNGHLLHSDHGLRRELELGGRYEVKAGAVRSMG